MVWETYASFDPSLTLSSLFWQQKYSENKKYGNFSLKAKKFEENFHFFAFSLNMCEPTPYAEAQTQCQIFFSSRKVDRFTSNSLHYSVSTANNLQLWCAFVPENAPLSYLSEFLLTLATRFRCHLKWQPFLRDCLFLCWLEYNLLDYVWETVVSQGFHLCDQSVVISRCCWKLLNNLTHVVIGSLNSSFPFFLCLKKKKKKNPGKKLQTCEEAFINNQHKQKWKTRIY